MEFHGSWSVLTATFIIVLYLAQGGALLSSIVHLSHVAGITWRADIAPYADKMIYLYPLALVLLVVLLALPDYTFPYYHPSLAGRFHLNLWHSYPFLVVREVGLFLTMAAVHIGFVRASVRDYREPGQASQKTLTRFAAVVPIVYAIYGTGVAWDFEMTLTPGWHSPIYAPYFFVSNFHMFLGFFVVLLFLLRLFRRYGRVVTDQTFNYLAQMMLGFTLLWTYTFFVQFITIWYGALPEETERLYRLLFADGDIRRGASALAPLFWWFLVLKSFVPFGLLIFAVFRHIPALTAVVGAVIFVGTCLERYTWIVGAYAAEHAPLTAVFNLVIVGLAGAGVVALLWAALTGNGARWLGALRLARR